MAVSTFFGLQTSLRGLLAHQRSLDVTGHNVANASTVGYSRQEAVLTSSLPQIIAAGARPDGSGAQLGSGVEVGEYRRIRDMFLDVQYRAQASVLSDADAKARSLEGVELALAEPGENGISHQLAKFWSAWANVANDATSVPARQALIEQGKTVASAFAELDAQLATIAQQASRELAAITAYDPATGVYGDVASIATELAQVGASIRDAVLTGQQPLDLYDHRDLLLDRLSQFGSVSTADHGDGGIVVMFGGSGVPLVDDHRLDDPATPGDERVVWSSDPAELVSPGGKLGALLALSADDGTIANYRASLTEIVQTIASTVNGVHSQGPDGLDFFSLDPARGAAGLAVAIGVADIDTGRSGAAGANDIALEIAALRGGAADGAYQAFVTRIGSEARQNSRVQANAQVLVDAVEDRRQSAAGVSLDEEMTNLMRFQRGYQASARTMSTLDEMLDVLINRTGRVGL